MGPAGNRYVGRRPSLGCDCPVCTSVDPRDRRTRCAVAVGLREGILLIDTPPDLRTQLLRERIGIVHAVLYTHDHADHLFGLDDLRLFPFYLGHAVPIYCREEVEQRIRRVFDYAFTDLEPTHPGAVPQLEFHTIDQQPFVALGEPIVPIRLRHGPRFEVLGFRIGKHRVLHRHERDPPGQLAATGGTGRADPGRPSAPRHPTHFSLDEAVAVAHRVGAKQTYFTHISHDLSHEQTNRELPLGMALGLRRATHAAVVDSRSRSAKASLDRPNGGFQTAGAAGRVHRTAFADLGWGSKTSSGEFGDCAKGL